MQSLSAGLARRVLDTAPDAMIIVDDSGSVRFANQQASVLFGYSHGELIGKPVGDLMPELPRTQCSSLKHAFGNNMCSSPMGSGLDLVARRADGTELPVELSLSKIADGNRVVAAVAIRDVIDRKRIESALSVQLEEMRRLQEMSARLLEAADLPKMLKEVLDATMALQRADFGSIQLRDPGSGTLKIAAQRGFSDEILQYFESIDQTGSSASGRALRTGERVIIEDVESDTDYLPHRTIAAHEGYRAVQSTPIRGRAGTVLGICSTQFHEPHRPSEHGLQLTDLYMRLVAELLARAQDEDAVRVAGNLATRASQAKSRFLATASHDLRQPLQALALLNGTLRRISANPIADDALAQQDLAITSMSRLINALLDISKLESGTIMPELTDFSLGALFGELREEFTALAAGKGLDLEVSSCDESVHSDPALVEQILRNLIANAIKYTEAGRVALRCVHDQTSCVRIEVADSGIGIPAEQLRYIYDEFYQVGPPGKSAREGYGLGLSIVQRLVTLLDVKLEVKSAVGKGSKFAFALPAGHAGARPGACIRPEPNRDTNQAGGRVLLVEDDPAVRTATRMLLRSEGYQVTAVDAAAGALERAREDPRIDLLVTDYHLSEGGTGAQVITALRAALDRPLKAVLITGDTSSAVKELPRDALLRFVSKPVQSDELLGVIRALLNS